ncbi:MAG: 4-hydroxy-tetrahydrodipicolinate reductase [Bacteroidales bacterium]|jgi:4-hydroxy-tetrahydrodipicolinate reductase|nr:4-hydroxy-tetrahydrodipicolinate reductase [Bacteroidales bacterium]
MNIVITGYGKMGEEVEKVAFARKHKIVAYIDREKDWQKLAQNVQKADIAIDFSTPDCVLDNIKHCFDAHLPIVVGTTGWYEHIETVKKRCLQENQSLLYAANFSIGVNLFFSLNRQLAILMNQHQEYNVSIEESHHVNKKDSPSGTALVLANDILKNLIWKKGWYNELSPSQDAEFADNQTVIDDIPASQIPLPWEELVIKSERSGNNIGTHIVSYESEFDKIEIRHSAFSRRSFASGAVSAAEWLIDKKGFFTINDMLKL